MATNTSGITYSSLNVQSLVSQLMSVERQPLNKISTSKTSLNSKISELGKLKSAMSSLQDLAKAFKSNTGAFKYDNSDSNVATMSATSASGSLALGTYDINVSSLAQSEKLVSGSFASKTSAIGTGNLTISFGKDNGSSLTPNTSKTDVSISIDSSNNTLEGVRDAINNSNSGIKATIIFDGSNYKLGITSPSGENNSLKITTDSTDGLSAFVYDPAGTKNLTKLQSSTSAKVNIDGVDVVSDTNKISSAIDGFEFNVKKVGTTSINVSRENNSLSNIQSFVTKYNEVMTSIKTDTDATSSSSVLKSESTIASIKYQLRDVMNSASLNDGSSMQNFRDLGLSFDKQGVLSVDETKFNAAMSSNESQAFKVLSNLSDKLTNYLSNTSGVEGVFQSKINTYSNKIKTLTDQETKLTDKLKVKEANYTAQYTKLAQILSENSQIGQTLNASV